MEERLRIKADQLARMRGMTRLYHERFFSDVRTTAGGIVGLFLLGWWQIPESFLLIPVVALLGATMTAFDASYLLFARHYAAHLEAELNAALGERTLLASMIENVYLFPLNERKIVVAALGSRFTWFGFMTLFITSIGVAAFVFALLLGLPVLETHGVGWTIGYLATLAGAVAAAFGVGVWWFIGGEGERRLRAVLEV